MKIILYLLVSIITINCSYSQVSKLVEYEKRIVKKVVVGMSGEELKKKIGNPKAVESGFPDTEDNIITDLPEQKGQLNYSTWFYFYDAITINVSRNKYFINKKEVSQEMYNDYIAPKFFLNKIEVSEGIYNDYKDLEEIYLVDSSIIYPAGKEHYQKEDSSTFSIQPKSRTDTYVLESKDIKGAYIKVVNVKKMFLPILCVLFDRGTQVVASTKVFFKNIQ